MGRAANTCCLWPLLLDILDIEDSTVGKSIKVNWNTTFLVIAFHFQMLLSVIWLSDGRHEHPLWSNDQGEANIRL
jgi:hypothetical protein